MSNLLGLVEKLAVLGVVDLFALPRLSILPQYLLVDTCNKTPSL